MAYVRKTRDVYEVQGNYGFGHGFECVNAEETRKNARRSIREYRENEPGIPFRIALKRERLEPVQGLITESEIKTAKQI